MVDNYIEIKKIKEYALTNKVPIMLDDGIKFLTSFISKHKIKTILEIGSAIGYSAIMMALVDPSIKIVTIERDEERYLEAVKNIKTLNLENQITLMYQDALEVNLAGKFDLVFIDAAKGQNMKFFEKFSGNLNDNGYIITDNINFHGFIDKDESEIKSKNLRQLVRKIKQYIEFLKENEIYETKFHDVGDGIAVSNKR